MHITAPDVPNMHLAVKIDEEVINCIILLLHLTEIQFNLNILN